MSDLRNALGLRKLAKEDDEVTQEELDAVIAELEEQEKERADRERKASRESSGSVLGAGAGLLAGAGLYKAIQGKDATGRGMLLSILGGTIAGEALGGLGGQLYHKYASAQSPREAVKANVAGRLMNKEASIMSMFKGLKYLVNAKRSARYINKAIKYTNKGIDVAPSFGQMRTAKKAIDSTKKAAKMVAIGAGAVTTTAGVGAGLYAGGDALYNAGERRGLSQGPDGKSRRDAQKAKDQLASERAHYQSQLDDAYDRQTVSTANANMLQSNLNAETLNRLKALHQRNMLVGAGVGGLGGLGVYNMLADKTTMKGNILSAAGGALAGTAIGHMVSDKA